MTHRRTLTLVSLTVALALGAAACGSDTDATTDTDGTATTSGTTSESMSESAASSTTSTPEPAAESTESPAVVEVSSSVRESGLTLTVQSADDLVVHSLTAPEQVFANSTHIIETANSLVVVDTQFLLPNAVDVRAYADELGKPIDRVFITHAHPDHVLGSEAFADVPMFALEDVSAAIAANGDAEVAEKQGDFGADAIAGSYVVPEVVEPGTVEIDGVVFELAEITDAEAEVQMVIRVPEAGVVATGDIVYSGVHLILAGPIDTWTAALTDLAADADGYPVVLPGHGLPTDPSVYDTDIAWLAEAGALLDTVDNAEDFKQGLVDAFPELGMTAAIDFVTPFLFPEA